MRIVITSAYTPDHVCGVYGALMPTTQYKSKYPGMMGVRRDGQMNGQMCGEMGEGTWYNVYHLALIHYPPLIS